MNQMSEKVLKIERKKAPTGVGNRSSCLRANPSRLLECLGVGLKKREGDCNNLKNSISNFSMSSRQ